MIFHMCLFTRWWCSAEDRGCVWPGLQSPVSLWELLWSFYWGLCVWRWSAATWGRVPLPSGVVWGEMYHEDGLSRWVCDDDVITSKQLWQYCPDSKVHGANMGPTWGRQDPGGTYVGHVNLAIWGLFARGIVSLTNDQYSWAVWTKCAA